MLRKWVEMHSGKKTNDIGWDEWSCFPFSLQHNLAVQPIRFWSFAYYQRDILNFVELQFLQGMRTLQIRTHADHWQPWGLEIWGLCWPLSILHHLEHQNSSKPLLTAQLSVLTPLAAEQIIFLSWTGRLQCPREEKYILFGFLQFCHFSRSGRGKGGENEQEFKHRWAGITLYMTHS